MSPYVAVGVGSKPPPASERGQASTSYGILHIWLWYIACITLQMCFITLL